MRSIDCDHWKLYLRTNKLPTLFRHVIYCCNRQPSIKHRTTWYPHQTLRYFTKSRPRSWEQPDRYGAISTDLSRWAAGGQLDHLFCVSEMPPIVGDSVSSHVSMPVASLTHVKPSYESIRMGSSWEGHVALPAAPSFEQIMATVTPEDQVMRAFRKRKLERFSTKMPRLDPESGEIREVDITEANALEISQMAEMLEAPDGKKVWRCPVPGCARTMARRVPYMEKHVRHAHVQGVLAGAICPSRVREKLCPLCRLDQGSHQRLLTHIVEDHDTRLECTEHEFSSVSHYEEWKERAMREAKCFLRLASHKSKLPAGTFVCCKAGRTRRPEVAVNRSRLLGFECPASMIVDLNDTGHVFVKFWRTHIGHAPHVLDVRCTAATHLFIRQCLDQNWTYGQVAAEACKDYFGGEIQRDQLLNYQDLRNAKKRLKLPAWLPNSEPKGLIGTMGRVQFRRLTLVKTIRAILEHGTNNETRVVTDAHEPYNGTWQELPGPRYIFSNLEGRTIAVVFPRRSAHTYCEYRCTHCEVCVHRYGCTCEQFLSELRMCRHIHAVAQRLGAPKEDPGLIEEGPSDNLGYDEALWVLARLNYEEKLKEIILLVDQLAHLIKGRHHVELDRLEDHIRSAIEVLRSSEPVRESVEDEARTVLANVSEQLNRVEQERKDEKRVVQEETDALNTAKTASKMNGGLETEVYQAARPATVADITLKDECDKNSSHIRQSRKASSQAMATILSLRDQPRYVMRRSFYTHLPKRGRARKYLLAGGSRLSTGGLIRHVTYRRTPLVSSVQRQVGPTVRAEVVSANFNPKVRDEIDITASVKLGPTVTASVVGVSGSKAAQNGSARHSRDKNECDGLGKDIVETDMVLSPKAEIKTEVTETEELNHDPHSNVKVKIKVITSEDDNALAAPPNKISRFDSNVHSDVQKITAPTTNTYMIGAPVGKTVEKNPPEPLSRAPFTGKVSAASNNEKRFEEKQHSKTAVWPLDGQKRSEVRIAHRTRSSTMTVPKNSFAITAAPTLKKKTISWSIATPKPSTPSISSEPYIHQTAKTEKNVQWNVANARNIWPGTSSASTPTSVASESCSGFALASACASEKIYIPASTSSMRQRSKILIQPSTESVTSSASSMSLSASTATKKIFIPASSVIGGGARPLKLHVPRSALKNATALYIETPTENREGVVFNADDCRPKMVRKVIKIIRRSGDASNNQKAAKTETALTAAPNELNVVLRRKSLQNTAFKQQQVLSTPGGSRCLDKEEECSIDCSLSPTTSLEVDAAAKVSSASKGASESHTAKADYEGTLNDSELNIGQVMRTMFEQDQ
ncbi:uncharacterized protein LOC111249408 isoform X4 [Varroa destructor]|uniref:SWIM-type domain-containing protein n=1 Tax=Varroa destructor TaxID=109461 RepID=A0A7M7JYE1_VARDE|nr:uncharacterized protein LOC111249408 isoform X4 [Varroa destructor]